MHYNLWIKEKEIQVLRSKQNITYLEAKKIIDSRTQTVGLSSAAASSKPKEKILKFIGIQTECPSDRNSQSFNNKINPQISNKHSNKQKERATEILNLRKPSTSILLVHKKKYRNYIK